MKQTTTTFQKRILSSILLLFAFLLTTTAQNVTVRPETGNLIGALSYSGGGNIEVGLTYGFSALWRHKQLPLSFMTADDNVLTPEGKILKKSIYLSAQSYIQ